MRFLFVTNTSRLENIYLDPSVRYRCFNPASDLQNLGHSADVCHIKHLKKRLLSNYDVFIFHKPSYNRKLKNITEIIKKNNQVLIADYDDLVFETEFYLSSPLLLTNRATPEIVLSICKENHKAFLLFDHYTVSTTPLKELVLHSHPGAEVKVTHNGLSKAWLDHGLIFPEKEEKKKIISYFSGTSSHDKDFLIFKDSMEKFLFENPNYCFGPVGPLNFDSQVSGNQIRRKKAVEFFLLPGLIVESWAAIAPLQDNIFNRCKSAIKFIESAAFGVPLICSPIPDMLRFKEAGLMIADSGDDLYSALAKLKKDDFYHHVSEKSRDYVRQNAMSIDQTRVLLEFIERDTNGQA